MNIKNISYLSFLGAILILNLPTFCMEPESRLTELDLNGTKMLELVGQRIMDDSLALNFQGSDYTITWLCVELVKPKHTLLQKLDLSKNFIHDEGVQQLAEFLQNALPYLRELNLANNRISEYGIFPLICLLKKDTFQYLVIYGNNGAASIDGIKELVTALGRETNNNLALIQKYLSKVIWVPKTWLDSSIKSGILPANQGEFHTNYYKKHSH